MNAFVWITSGVLILAGIWLSQTVSQRWLILSLLAGGYLLASGLTGWSPIERFIINLYARKRSNHKTHKK